MPKMTLPLGGGFYQSESLPLSAQRCINWFPVIPQTANAGSEISLFNTPGQKAFLSLGGENRGQHVVAGVDFAVSGNTLFQVNKDKSQVSIGTIEGVGLVSMAHNSTEAENGDKLVIVVPGGKSYVYDGDTLVQITDVDFRVSDTVSFKDGFFIFTASTGKVFFNSALNDPLNFRALDFGTAEISPDLIVASTVVHNELFIIGEETIELFQNIGGADFPFQRIQGANIQKGAHAKFGIVDLDETFAFAGGGKDELTGIYQVADSTKATKISTPAIDNEIQKFTKEEISNCIAMTYFDRGSQIAIWTFKSNSRPGRTFAYNATTSKLSGIPIWFEFQSGVSKAGNNWNINSISVAYGKILGGTESGEIVELDKDTYTDLGEAIKRQFTSGPFSFEEAPLFSPKIILWMESGVGLTNGNGSNPSVSMDSSFDGKTFGNDRVRKIGKIGKFGQQTVWKRNGRHAVFRVNRFTVTDPIKAIIRKLQIVAQVSGPNA